MNTQRWRSWWPVAVVTGLVLVFYWDLWLGRTFVWGDALTEYFAGLHYFCTSIRSGRFPLWIAEVRNGMPFYTDIQLALFYPPTWLLVLPSSAERLPFIAYQIFIVAHVVWGGWGMLWFLRGLGLRPVAAVIGAVTFCFAAFMSLHMVHAVMLQAYAWWPWQMECVRRLVTQRSRKPFFGLVATTALAVLAGHPQTTAYGLVLVTAYWIWLEWQQTPLTLTLSPRTGRGNPDPFAPSQGEKVRMRGWLKGLARIIGVPAAMWVAVFLLLGAVLLPVAENWRLSARTQATYAGTAEASGPVANLIGLIVPNFFGTLQATPSEVTFWGDAPHELPPAAGAQPWNYWEYGLYAGQLGLIAVVVLAFNARRQSGALFFLVMVGLGLWFYLGKNAGLFQIAYHLIPGAGLFRVPARMANVVNFSMAVLVAMFVEELLARNDLNLRRPLAIVVAVYVVLLVGLRWGASEMFPVLAESSAWMWSMRATAVAVGLGVAVLVVISLPVRWRAGLLVGLCFVDLWLAHGKFHRGLVNPDEYFADVGGVIAETRRRNQADQPLRFAQFRDAQLSEEVIFPINTGFVHHGFETPEGFTSFYLWNTGALQGLVTNTPVKLALQNVGATARQDKKTGRIILAPYPGLPRAKFYSRVREFATEKELFAALNSGVLDYRHEVGVLAGRWPTAEATGTVSILRHSPEAYDLHYDVTGPGIIFVSETDYPGWRAAGYETVRVFGAFQGIVIPQAGKGVVPVRFAPRVWRWGLLLSAVGAVGLVALMVEMTKRKQNNPSP